LSEELNVIKENVNVERSDVQKKKNVEFKPRIEEKKISIRIEKPMKTIQIVKKSEEGKFEITSLKSVDIVKNVEKEPEEIFQVMKRNAETNKEENEILNRKVDIWTNGLKDKCEQNNNERNIEVNVIFNGKEVIPPPVLTKTEDGYKVDSQNEIYSNLYLKKDADDPVILVPKELVNIPKKISKEEELEEKCCHGEAIGNNLYKNEDKMLGGDKSLKTFLAESKNISEEAIVKRKSFIENKEKLGTFYKTNIENLVEGRCKLAEARERFKFKRQEYLMNKELTYEMDPFKWDLVKCKDGKTKVRILEEDDKYKDSKEESLPEEEIILIRCSEPLQVEEQENDDE
jgi:hypothetical protein